MDNGTTASYAYGPEGRRVEETVGGVVKQFLYGEGGRNLIVLDGSGNILQDEVYAGARHLATLEGGTTPEWQLSDWLGTVRMATNSSGGTVDAYTSWPYGANLDHQGIVSNDHFTDKDHDSATGQDYFGARYYNPGAGRFLTPDSLADSDERNLRNPQDLNLYAYAWNNPVTLTDPSGHDVNVCVDENDTSESCFTISDPAYAELAKEQNTQQQGITMPTGTFPSGVITCGSGTCGSVQYSEPGLQDQTFNLLGLLGGVGDIARAATGVAEALGFAEADEGTTYVIGKMGDLEAPGALRAGETSVASEIGDLSQLASQQRWGVNGSVLRSIMAEGRPIRDISEEAARPGFIDESHKPLNSFLAAERNLLQNHGWTFSGGYWYPPK